MLSYIQGLKFVKGNIMSKKFVKNLTDDELNCYVCRKQIKPLAKLQKYRNGKIDVDTKILRSLREYVMFHVIPVVVLEDRKKVLRHSRCNPRSYQPTVEDL